MPTDTSASIVKDGRVSLGPRDPAQAAGLGPKQAPNAPDQDWALTPAGDPTQDPDWELFQKAHRESQLAQPLDNRQQRYEEELVSKLPPELAALLGPKSMKPALPAQPAKAADAAQPAETKNTGTPDEVTKRTNALQALKRDGYTDSMLKKLDDAELLEIGTKRYESQVAVDQKLGERRETIRETKQEPKSETKTESDATPAVGGPGQTASPTFDVTVKTAATELGQLFEKHFTEQFGEEIGKPLGSSVSTSFESALKKFAAPLLEKNASLEQGLEMLAGFLEESVANETRRGWKDEFPAVADDGTWEKIRDAYTTLASSGKYQGRAGMQEAYEHARRIVLPGVQSAAVVAKNAAENKEIETKSFARPTIGARSSSSGAATEDQELFQKFLAAHQLAAQYSVGQTGVQ